MGFLEPWAWPPAALPVSGSRMGTAMREPVCPSRKLLYAANGTPDGGLPPQHHDLAS